MIAVRRSAMSSCTAHVRELELADQPHGHLVDEVPPRTGDDASKPSSGWAGKTRGAISVRPAFWPP